MANILNYSSGIGTKLTFFADLINICVEYINADDVIAFCLYLMNKMRRNLIKIRSCAILGGSTGLTGFCNYFEVDKCLGFPFVAAFACSENAML